MSLDVSLFYEMEIARGAKNKEQRREIWSNWGGLEGISFCLLKGRKRMAKKGEIVIEENFCKGCGLCVLFCKKKCISMDKIGPGGFPIAHVSSPETCNGCGICGWMCPDMAIEVYEHVAGRSL